VAQEWDAADAQYIRTFFSQPTGRKFLRLVQSSIPKVRATKLEEVQIEALKKQGAEDIVDVILNMTGDIEPEFKEGRDWVDLTQEGD
jgi:hypothetical protein